MFKEKLPLIGGLLSLLLFVGTITVIVSAFVRLRKQPHPPSTVPGGKLKDKVTSVGEGAEYVETKDGRKVFRLLFAKDTQYEDGRHDLEKVDLVVFDEQPGKNLRVISDRGTYQREQGILTFAGNVKLRSSDGLEVLTESLKYEQAAELASTEVAIQFRQGDVSGSAIGARLYTKARNLILLNDARVVNANPDFNKTPNKTAKKPENVQPVEIRSERATYTEAEGLIRFDGNARAVHGEKYAQADLITGVVATSADKAQTKKLVRIEMRGNSYLKSEEAGKASEMKARDIDFFFDDQQQLKSAVGTGQAYARSLEKDAPREVSAERIEVSYRPVENGSVIKEIDTQGRTVMKIEVEGREVSQRVLEADAMKTFFHDDGKNLERAEAVGGAVLTITPKKLTPVSEKKILRAAKFNAEFYETGNALKNFLADGKAVAQIDPLPNDGQRTKKTLSGNKMTGSFDQQTQDATELIAEGNAKFNDGDRNGTSVRATYRAATRLVELRGKPLLWDSATRANADEIDSNVDTDESFLRGRVRTTYLDREKTAAQATPFKSKKSAVTIVSEHAVMKHNEGAARYDGNVRAWQDDDFVSAENMELDKGERTMVAWGNARSIFYDFEREVEKGRKETVPVFAQSDRITYHDETRTAHYEGTVKIRQGTDRIDAATADAVMDEDNKLISWTGDQDVVLTQPFRRATGDHVVYTAKTDTAVLTGDPALAQDNEHESVTKSPKLTMHLHDARIEANDESGMHKRVKTTHRIQK